MTVLLIMVGVVLGIIGTICLIRVFESPVIPYIKMTPAEERQYEIDPIDLRIVQVMENESVPVWRRG